MSTLAIPRGLYESVRAHGRQAYPRESCGILLGLPAANGWRVSQALRACNASAGSAPDRYEIAPAELVRVQREAARQGLEIAGFYHSHPDRPAQWSHTDFAEAHWLGCCYLITEVVAGRAEATRSFLLAGTTEEDKHFEPQAIAVEEEAAGAHAPL